MKNSCLWYIKLLPEKLVLMYVTWHLNVSRRQLPTKSHEVLHSKMSVTVSLIFWSVIKSIFFSFCATSPIWALAYLHETLRFTSVC
jgi:hypothetical protein